MGFLMPKVRMPAMPPPPAPPPPAPTRDSEEIRKAEQAEKDRSRRQAGRKASILTSGRGLLDEGPIDKPSLIGDSS